MFVSLSSDPSRPSYLHFRRPGLSPVRTAVERWPVVLVSYALSALTNENLSTHTDNKKKKREGVSEKVKREREKIVCVFVNGPNFSSSTD